MFLRLLLFINNPESSNRSIGNSPPHARAEQWTAVPLAESSKQPANGIAMCADTCYPKTIEKAALNTARMIYRRLKSGPVLAGALPVPLPPRAAR